MIRFLREIWDFFMPQDHTCLVCGGMYFDSLQGGLCPVCRSAVREAEAADLRGLLTADCAALDGAYSLVRYGDGSREQVHALKFGGIYSLGPELGREMAACAARLPETPDALIPVPLHRRRRHDRGYNQAEMLARGIREVTGLNVRTDILLRAKRTSQNAKLDHEKRQGNVRGAFACGESPQGLSLVLIDDVLTTGATVCECAKTLKAAGARKVYVITYAKAGDR